MAEAKENNSEFPQENVKLHEADKPWKPSFKQKAPSDAESVLKVEKIKRNVLKTLNMISPQKYNTHLNQIKKLNIDSKNELDIMLELIYERATVDPLYSIIYTQLYKDILLEKKTAFDIKEEEVERKIQIYHQLGNMKFIGELFKLNILTEVFIEEFIKKLFSLNNEKSLESICQLLKTIGKELEEKNINSVNLYFSQIQEVLSKKSTSTRIRFMLEDIIELRKNYWVPRRVENCPRTIDAIHLEIVQEVMGLNKPLKGGKSKPELPLKSSESSNLTGDEVTLKIKLLIENFLEKSNIELATSSATEILSSTTIRVFVKIVIHLVIGRSSQNRNSVGELLLHLVQHKTITFEQYKDGFAYALEMWKELPSNICIWNNIAEILLPMLRDENSSLSALKDILKSCAPSKSAGQITSTILHYLVKEKGSSTVQKMWEQSGLKWTDILGRNADVKAFISAHNLDFITDCAALPNTDDEIADKYVK